MNKKFDYDEMVIVTSPRSAYSDEIKNLRGYIAIGFLFQAAQNYHGAGLASAMRTDLVTAYEGTILKNLMVTKKWFNLIVQNKWLEQPPLAPNRKEIAKEV